MRLRFSLRTLFVITTLVAALCLWFMLPSLTARRFLAAVASEDYPSADEFFLQADDRVLTDWADKRWSFRSSGNLLPLTFGQLCRNQRTVRVECTYFQYDQNFKCELLIAATPFGLKKPQISKPEVLGVLYEGRGGRAVPRN